MGRGGAGHGVRRFPGRLEHGAGAFRQQLVIHPDEGRPRRLSQDHGLHLRIGGRDRIDLIQQGRFGRGQVQLRRGLAAHLEIDRPVGGIGGHIGGDQVRQRGQPPGRSRRSDAEVRRVRRLDDNIGLVRGRKGQKVQAQLRTGGDIDAPRGDQLRRRPVGRVGREVERTGGPHAQRREIERRGAAHIQGPVRDRDGQSGSGKPQGTGEDRTIVHGQRPAGRRAHVEGPGEAARKQTDRVGPGSQQHIAIDQRDDGCRGGHGRGGSAGGAPVKCSRGGIELLDQGHAGCVRAEVQGH